MEDKLKQVRDSLHNIGGNVYHGMADDVRDNERSPDWQYVLEQVKIGTQALDELIDQQSKGVDEKDAVTYLCIGYMKAKNKALKDPALFQCDRDAMLLAFCELRPHLQPKAPSVSEAELVDIFEHALMQYLTDHEIEGWGCSSAFLQHLAKAAIRALSERGVLTAKE